MSYQQSEKMTFFTFVLFGALNDMGWPREQGRFRKRKVVSHTVLASALNIIHQQGAIIGVEFPKDGIAILAEAFLNRDWVAQPIEDLLEMLDVGEMHDFVQDMLDDIPEHKQLKATVDWKELSDPKFFVRMQMSFLRTLVRGFLHPERVRPLLEHDLRVSADDLADLEVLKQHGLEVEGVPATLEYMAGDVGTLIEAHRPLRMTQSMPRIVEQSPIVAARLQA